MALIKCCKCGFEIENITSTCPQCGFIMPFSFEENSLPIELKDLQQVVEKADAQYKANNYSDALKLYEYAAELGSAYAQNMLGMFCHMGFGLKKADHELAKEWFKMAAIQHNADALNNLGSLYSKGLGVEKNDKFAFKYYQKATKFGSSSAMYNLGTSYEKGNGTRIDQHLATSYFKMAFDKGFKSADLFNNLGVRYMDGIGVSVDYNMALKLLTESESLGYKKASENLELLHERIQKLTIVSVSEDVEIVLPDKFQVNCNTENNKQSGIIKTTIFDESIENNSCFFSCEYKLSDITEKYNSSDEYIDHYLSARSDVTEQKVGFTDSPRTVILLSKTYANSSDSLGLNIIIKVNENNVLKLCINHFPANNSNAETRLKYFEILVELLNGISIDRTELPICDVPVQYLMSKLSIESENNLLSPDNLMTYSAVNYLDLLKSV